MLRICLIVAIVAGLAAGAVSFFKVQDIITTTRQARDDYNGKWTNEVSAHTKTKATLKKTTADLETTKKDLDQTRVALDAANTKVSELDKQNTDLTAKLEKASADRDTAQQELERWRGVGVTPDQVRGMIADLEKTRKERAALITENKVVSANRDDWRSKYENLVGTNGPVPLPDGLRGKILAVDPKYDFVVLDIGEDQGVKKRGEMMVDRNGKLLGKVRIYSVQKDRCVANIMPGWNRGEILEGDEVLY
jgi:flagellar biosynthesis chaperone FliJ